MHFSLFLTLLLTLPLTLAAPLLLPKHSYSGDGTFYTPGLGACGIYNAASDHIVALSAAEFDNGAACGKTIRAKQAGSNHYVTAKVVDLCAGCVCLLFPKKIKKKEKRQKGTKRESKKDMLVADEKKCRLPDASTSPPQRSRKSASQRKAESRSSGTS
jgi:hypothetical protein